ncbi:fasciclin domain-containing protein [Plebeiibacterium sediminum]|uniref:Fasciclin domain-containing protein n=1 Tax=Plebeiibacterium sediminum TaxID=2992112 RepID=A0AAE3SEZ3_9BACT|nr:fasciclin domain-containing protein [Plebeiobacterium sediminum]MCW3787003.1 fasciclin domain-containing protein [Plebeiobacterium sediminum]
MKYKFIFISLLLASLIIWGCSDQWDDYTKIDGGVAGSDVLTSLKANSDYSEFVSLLENTGIAKEISSSKIYTIWVPTNAALSNNAGLIPEEEDQLKSFLLNHISYDKITYDDHSGSVNLKMASGKKLWVNYSDKTIDNIQIGDSKDLVVSNGVIHTIETPITLRSTIWEYIKDLDYDEVDFLNSLTYMVFNADSATQTGIDPETGEAVYDTISGMVQSNVYMDLIADLSCEDSTYTFFIMDDASFSSENGKFRKYYTKATDTQTDSMSMLHIVSDLVANKEYETISGSLESVSGMPIPVTSSSVISSYKASNGIVYFINNYSLPVTDRIKEIFIEAEYPYPDSLNINTQSVFKLPDAEGTIVTWARNYASNSHCITSPSSTYSLRYVDYFIDDVYTCKYDIYWVSVTETESEAAEGSTVSQCMKLVEYTMNEEEELVDNILYTSDFLIPSYTDNIQEQYVGQFEVDLLNSSISYRVDDQGSFHFDNYIRLRVEGRNGVNTPIYLDYFKLVPIIE